MPALPVQEASSSDADSVNHRFIATALPHLVPLLLEQLTKQEEGQETDDGVWNVSMAAGTCLALCASVASDAIVPLVMPYVTANIQVGAPAGCAVESLQEALSIGIPPQHILWPGGAPITTPTCPAQGL